MTSRHLVIGVPSHGKHVVTVTSQKLGGDSELVSALMTLPIGAFRMLSLSFSKRLAKHTNISWSNSFGTVLGAAQTSHLSTGSVVCFKLWVFSSVIRLDQTTSVTVQPPNGASGTCDLALDGLSPQANDCILYQVEE